jgi:SAM-dependent methyltransferase
MVERLKYKETYEERAKDAFEERFDASRLSRIPFYFRYCLPPITKDMAYVLDVGAADGIVIQRYGERGIGCDIAATYCLKMHNAGIQSICCDAESLPFTENCFNLVIVSAILEHVLDPDSVISEVWRVVCKGGYCFINVPYKEDLTPYSHCKYKFSHLRSFDDRSILEMFANKFSKEIIHLHDFSFLTLKIKSPLLNRILEIGYLFFKKFGLESFLIKLRIRPFSLSILFRKLP